MSSQEQQGETDPSRPSGSTGDSQSHRPNRELPDETPSGVYYGRLRRLEGESAWIRANLAEFLDLIEALVMQETYDGVVVEACDDTAVVKYDVGEDPVEQTYNRSQFVGERLPAEGTRLRVQVKVFELPADDFEDFNDEQVELTDESIARGPERLTGPTEF